MQQDEKKEQPSPVVDAQNHHLLYIGSVPAHFAKVSGKAAAFHPQTTHAEETKSEHLSNLAVARLKPASTYIQPSGNGATEDTYKNLILPAIPACDLTLVRQIVRYW